MATVEATAQRGDLGTTGRLPADEAEIDTLMRRFFVQSQVKPIKAFEPDVKGVDAQGSAPRRDFDMATELLDRASHSGLPSFYEITTSLWIASDRCITSAKRSMRGRRRTSGMLGMLS